MSFNGKLKKIFISSFSIILGALLVFSPLTLEVMATGAGETEEIISVEGETQEVPSSRGATLGTSGKEEDSQTEASGDEATTEGAEGAPEKALEELLISNEEALLEFAKRVNDGDTMEGYRVALTGNIALTQEEWEPIGNSPANPFSGIFDGEDYEITGLKVNREVNGGLFGYLLNATIRKVKMIKPVAANSTAGIFYSASLSTIELSQYQVGRSRRTFMTSYSDSGTTDTWNPTATRYTDNWYTDDGHALPLDPSMGVFELSKGSDLAELARLVNLGGQIDPSTQFILTQNIDLDNHAWTPIGDNSAPLAIFDGNFYGNGKTISNLNVNAPGANAGLFGDVSGTLDTSTRISDLTIKNSNIQGKTAGALLGNAFDVNISNITILNTVVIAEERAGGVAGDAFGALEVSATNLTVYNSTIKTLPSGSGSNYAGGIFANAGLTALTQSMVVGGSIEAEDQAAGLIANLSLAPSSIATVSNNIVFGVDFPGTTLQIDGLMGKNGAGDRVAVLSDNIVSGITSNGANIYLGTREVTYGAERNFTDSILVNDFIKEDSFANNNIWDNNVDILTNPLSDRGNGPKNTGYLTTGAWVPSRTAWVGKENYFPQLKAHQESSNAFNKAVSSLAATAVIPMNENGSYTGVDSARNLVLMKKGPNGEDINWTLTQILPIGVTKFNEDKTSYADYNLISTEENLVTIDITMSMNTMYGPITKHIGIVNLTDGILTEDITQRIDYKGHGASGPEFEAKYVELTQALELTFIDPITSNTNVQSGAELYAKDRNGDYYLVESIPVDTVKPGVFEINGQVVRTFFTLRTGMEYKVRFPKGMVVESLKTDNESDEVFAEFKTVSVGRPVVSFASKEIQWTTTQQLTMADLTNGITVFRNGVDSNADKLYDGPSGAVLTAYAGAWDDNNPKASAESIAAGFPNNVDTVQYYLTDSAKALGATPEAQVYQLYVMAKNKENKSSYAMLTVTVAGEAAWSEGKEPKDIVHIPWTNNIEAIKSAAKQGKSAVVLMNGTNYIPVPVRMDIVDLAAWEAIKEDRNSPAAVDVKITVTNQAGQVSNISKVVTVYLDKHLSYTVTPSPIIMSYTTPGQVEERINFIAKNFKKADVKTEHFENKYRSAGVYYVDITSEEQYVTLCGDKKCISDGIHPANKVDESFEIHIHNPLGPEIESYWGNAAAEIEDTSYSRESIQLEPKSYLLPSFMLNLLKKQEYGKLQLSFFDEYRWNVYSSTLNTNYKWGDAYSLRIDRANNKNITKLLGSNNNAIQFVFQNEGKLFGAVEFEINLDKARERYSNLGTKNLALYRYDSKNNELIKVSNMLVDTEGIWASAVITETLPATYVIKGEASANEPIVAEVITTGVKEPENIVLVPSQDTRKTTSFTDDNGNLVVGDTSNRTFLGEKQIDTTKMFVDVEASTINTGFPMPIIIVTIILAVLAIAGSVYYFTIGKEKK